ncbi:hypothetical protein BST26_07810, partial [Mycolicibacterium insubricum]
PAQTTPAPRTPAATTTTDSAAEEEHHDVPPTVPHFPQAPSTQNPVRQAQIPGTTCREAA